MNTCTDCGNTFDWSNPKHHCRLCGLIYCDSCSRHKLIVPEEDLVIRPRGFLGDLVAQEEDDFREPQRICNKCAPTLEEKQDRLKAEVSRCNMETSVDVDSSSVLLPQINFFMENEIQKIFLPEVYKIEKILDKKVIRGKIFYKVRWLSYGADADSWISEKQLT